MTFSYEETAYRTFPLPQRRISCCVLPDVVLLRPGVGNLTPNPLQHDRYNPLQHDTCSPSHSQPNPDRYHSLATATDVFLHIHLCSPKTLCPRSIARDFSRM